MRIRKRGWLGLHHKHWELFGVGVGNLHEHGNPGAPKGAVPHPQQDDLRLLQPNPGAAAEPNQYIQLPLPIYNF